ncbi:MAG: putative baseplate assembly protein [Xenococcaceae cyanobacterium]
MLPKENLDDRTFEDLVAECVLRIPRYCPEWTDFNPSDPGITLVELFAWLTDQMLMRFNKVPRRNYITFLELLGIKLQPPAPAQTDVSFYVTQPDSYPYTIPQGTEVGTERTETEPAIIFSTEQDLLIGQPEIIHFLTAETLEDTPSLLRDRFTNQWIGENNGEWRGEEQPLFNEQPEVGNCFYLVLNSQQSLAGNAIAVIFKGASATPTGIDPNHPPRSWSAWNGTEWVSILMREEDDYTGGFSFNNAIEDGNTIPTGKVILHLPHNLTSTDFQGYEGYWLQCVFTQPTEGQGIYRQTPKIVGINTQAVGGTVAAKQSFLIRDELLGVSDGRPGQSFSLQNVPVLNRRSDEHILVIPPGSPPQTWTEVRDFANSSPSDRHYTIDSLTGTVAFGPLIQEPSRHVVETKFRATQTQLPVLGNYSTRLVGNIDGTLEKQYGSVPPKGAEIRMRCYRTGGGRQGNVESGTLKILKSAIPYISRVTNYQPARGGSDPESLNQAMLRAPQILRTRDRAVTKEDFEVLTLKAGEGSIARSLCLPVETAGTVSVLVIPEAERNNLSDGLSPENLVLTPFLRQQTLNYLNERKLLGVRILLREPNYVGVAVTASIGLEPMYQNDRAEEIIRQQLKIALYKFLNPLTGGIEGEGWKFGRPVYISDIIALFQKIAGVRYIGEVMLNSFYKQNNTWVRHPAEPRQVIDPGRYGLICSWKDYSNPGHTIHFLTE